MRIKRKRFSSAFVFTCSQIEAKIFRRRKLSMVLTNVIKQHNEYQISQNRYLLDEITKVYRCICKRSMRKDVSRNDLWNSFTFGPESANRIIWLTFFVTCVSIDRAKLNGFTIQWLSKSLHSIILIYFLRWFQQWIYFFSRFWKYEMNFDNS